MIKRYTPIVSYIFLLLIIISACQQPQKGKQTTSDDGKILQYSGENIISEDLVIPEGSILKILPGSKIKLNDKVNIVIEGKILAAKYAREHKVPYFGICLGMHMAVIEIARNLLNLEEAHGEEFDPYTPDPVIYLMKEWYDEQTKQVEKRDDESDKGGTMRLGAYPCHLVKDTFAMMAYKEEVISERHRHRFEFNNAYKDRLVEAGLIISGTSPDHELVEIVELADHPWYLACQFHPEFKSKPGNPHPLFRDFVKASMKNAKK